MFEGPIVAAQEISHRNVHRTETETASLGETMLGLILLGVGLPLLVLRLLGWALIRDMRRVIMIAGSMGQAAIAAARAK